MPAYAIIVREHVLTKQASTHVGTLIMATLVGMAIGGWMSGKVFDLTRSYNAAFINDIAWNLLNLGIVVMLLVRVRRNRRRAFAVA